MGPTTQNEPKKGLWSLVILGLVLTLLISAGIIRLTNNNSPATWARAIALKNQIQTSCGSEVRMEGRATVRDLMLQIDVNGHRYIEYLGHWRTENARGIMVFYNSDKVIFSCQTGEETRFPGIRSF